jgi:hypothetical protein
MPLLESASHGPTERGGVSKLPKCLGYHRLQPMRAPQLRCQPVIHPDLMSDRTECLPRLAASMIVNNPAEMRPIKCHCWCWRSFLFWNQPPSRSQKSNVRRSTRPSKTHRNIVASNIQHVYKPGRVQIVGWVGFWLGHSRL